MVFLFSFFLLEKKERETMPKFVAVLCLLTIVPLRGTKKKK